MILVVIFICSFVFPPQDEKIHLYSIQGNTLKDEGKTIDAKGTITEMAYSPNGAYLATVDDKKVAAVYCVADDYKVDVCLSYTFFLWASQYTIPYQLKSCLFL